MTYFYKNFGSILDNLDFDNEPTPLSKGEFEIITLCRQCAQLRKKDGDILEEIDLAGKFDECCDCDRQN